MPRPLFHLTSREGWLNDPLGLTYHDGAYHLFFQHLPGRMSWSPECRWGHATSTDLLGWEQQPDVLSPGDGDGGCWSGSVVTAGDEALIFYTSVDTDSPDVGRVRVARPTDRSWRAWRKGPVVAELPLDVGGVAFRDPYVMLDGERWRMVVGAALGDGTAAALAYSSADLDSWTYDGILGSRSGELTERAWTGALWECPQLFPVGDRHVLVVSVWDNHVLSHVAYAVGTYRDGRFEPAGWQRLTYGPSYYATSTFVDADGRRGLISWLRGVADIDAGWAGALSVPQVVRLEADRLVVEPHPAVAARRTPAGPVAGPVTGDALDLEWDPPAGAPGRLSLAAAAGGGAEIQTEPASLTVTVPGGSQPAWRMPYDGGLVRLLVDGPVLELFCRTGMLAAPLVTDGWWVSGYDGELAYWRLPPGPIGTMLEEG